MARLHLNWIANMKSEHQRHLQHTQDLQRGIAAVEYQFPELHFFYGFKLCILQNI